MENEVESLAGGAIDIRYAVVLGASVVNVIMWDGIEVPNEVTQTPFYDGMRELLGDVDLFQLPTGSFVGPGWTYADGEFAPPVPPAPLPLTAEQALSEKTARVAYATTIIAPLQDMVDLGEATPEEEVELLAWKRYRIALTRITSTTAGWPASIVWPAMPA